ncbi:hypothetical protein [Ferrimonas pelagia]|uniref:Uncharacterized protein n=1 Tax=Ferrimonas pelagia TaxID=1177826 RepID=A0ABP9FI10_9GAMM
MFLRNRKHLKGMLLTGAAALLALSAYGWLQQECTGTCLQAEAKLKWHQWIAGSDSGQIHFVDLLELLYRPQDNRRPTQ